MLDREACERRVYRLATLLTGDRVAAVRVIEAVLSAQPRLERLGNARMDRLTVLRSREIEPAILIGDDVPAPAAEALSRLDAQSREAWVFARLYGMPLRSAAKAMDCSVTAAERHLGRADDAMRREPAGDAVIALRTFATGLPVPAFYRARRRARRRVRRALLAALLLLIVTAAGAGVLWWRGMLSWSAP